MTAASLVPPPSRLPAEIAARVLRMVLAVLVVALGVSSYVSTPVQRPLGDLLHGLAAGTVRSVQVEVPPANVSGSGFAVRWSTGSPRPYASTYDLQDGTLAPPNQVLAAVARSPRQVHLTTTEFPPTPPSGLQSHGVVVLLVVLAVLGLLVYGREPSLATRWGWFWLASGLPVAAVAFLLLEPVPLWQPSPLRLRRRVTGGWAFLLGSVGATVGAHAFPSLVGLLWSSR